MDVTATHRHMSTLIATNAASPKHMESRAVHRGFDTTEESSVIGTFFSMYNNERLTNFFPYNKR